ncbi:MAG TPA: sensor domain-containing diguanylate cyclase [Arenimonas sp.]|uniref:sensor domain-containing diguanylate cyclase n=1 Tax=Arenimonas sp. TaxID=1872635 RepID=UPI002BF9BF6D|nr:sensor domain-containing diguanylate cyclase [Arenimonas sp.]HMB56217.1 sensor domain-containing diguanylate cyclase [Arenimonas sp.]
MTSPAPPLPPVHWPLLTCGIGMLLLLVWLGLGQISPAQATFGILVGVVLLLLMRRMVREIQQQIVDNLDTAHAFRQELAQVQQDTESHSADLGLLGRYGNLLLGCLDLAEALQTSQQMLSLLLPGSAGSIYPLIDGEGLAEASHLWGIHVCNSVNQASAQECWAMQRNRLHIAHSHSAETLCPHVLASSTSEIYSTACIPLIAQGESLGWIYLSSPGPDTYPKMQVAVAAAEQLALALANLKLRQSLRDQSVRDPLTGLFNRRYLTESLGREMARSGRRKLPLAVMTFDLDHFKAFNDTYGHAAGDAVLVAFSRLLQSASRSEDIACRMGGEEFVLIMPEMDLEVATRRANELLAAMGKLVVMHTGNVLPPLTTSIGLALFPEHGRQPDRLLAAADQALYRAKSQGRKQMVVAETNSDIALP